jgi:hypothetical protein
LKKNPFIGKWHITEMEQWDSDFINEEVEGYIEFGKEDRGDFQFGYVQGSMDCEIETVDGKPRIEFSWSGHDERDEAGGRGWARIEDDGAMYGKIAFHMGDRSWFKAKRMK